MPEGEPFGRDVGADRAEQGRGGAADVGPDRDGERVVESDLAGRKCGHREQHGRVARLHHHRGKGADRGVGQKPGVPRRGIGAQVELLLKELGADLQVMDAEEDQPQADEDVARGRESAFTRKAQHHAERDEGQRVACEIERGPSVAKIQVPVVVPMLAPRMSASPLFKEIIFAETKDVVMSETMPLDWVATVAKKAENEAAEGAAGAGAHQRFEPAAFGRELQGAGPAR